MFVTERSNSFTGVAPEVNIRAYKVIGPSVSLPLHVMSLRFLNCKSYINAKIHIKDQATIDIIIAAYLMAYEDGVDVIVNGLPSTGGGYISDP
jgi:hypothetical protein